MNQAKGKNLSSMEIFRPAGGRCGVPHQSSVLGFCELTAALISPLFFSRWGTSVRMVLQGRGAGPCIHIFILETSDRTRGTPPLPRRPLKALFLPKVMEEAVQFVRGQRKGFTASVPTWPSSLTLYRQPLSPVKGLCTGPPCCYASGAIGPARGSA